MGKRLPKAIKPDEFGKLINCTKDKTARVSFLLAYNSGLRLSEVTSLQKEHIQENHIEVWSGKGGKDRTVPKPKSWRTEYEKYIPVKKTGRSLERNSGKHRQELLKEQQRDSRNWGKSVINSVIKD